MILSSMKKFRAPDFLSSKLISIKFLGSHIIKLLDRFPLA